MNTIDRQTTRARWSWLTIAALGVWSGSCVMDDRDGTPSPSSTSPPETPQWTYTPTPATPTPTPPCDETTEVPAPPEAPPWPAEWPAKECEAAITHAPPASRLAPGELDPTFAEGGILRLASRPVLNVAEQPDGRILYVGWNMPTDDILLCRIERDGAPDLTFGTSDGCVVSPLGGLDLALRANRIYLAGSDPIGNGLFVARFDENGEFDSSFGTDGISLHLPPFGFDYATPGQMRLGPEHLYLTAHLGTFPPADAPYPPAYPMLLRLNLDGSLDAAFGEDGYVAFATETNWHHAAVLPLPDGRVLATSRNGLFAFHHDGTKDLSFGAGRGCSNPGAFNDLLGTEDGIVAIGSGLAVGSISPDGTLEEYFSYVGTRIGPTDGAIDSSNAIVGGGTGWRPDGDSPIATIARRRPDGTLDEGFGPGGARHYSGFGSNTFGTALEVQCDGRYVLGGHADTSSGFILRVWD